MRLAWLAALLVTTAAGAGAAPLARGDVPEPLCPWVDWVLQGHEREACPLLTGSQTRACVWPGRLEIAVDAHGADFNQELFAAAPAWAALPAGAPGPAVGALWPTDVALDGRSAVVLERDGQPMVWLEPGAHRLAGRIPWSEMPTLLRIPPQTGLVGLRRDGVAVPFPRHDAQGGLWLREPGTAPDGAAAGEADRLELDAVRLVVDDIPLRLHTHLELRVAGAARELLLGPVLPAGFAPLSVTSGLPARLEPDGRLRVQARPGRYVIDVLARHLGPVEQLALPAHAAGDAAWPAVEVWAFRSRPALRLVDVEGALALDPSQTRLPEAWRALPAYRMEPDTTLRLVERSRGSEGSTGDQLQLTRRIHLDFDGGGATVSDALAGELRSASRLEVDAATQLGRAAVNGVDQPITRLGADGRAGVEVPFGSVQVDADSRLEGHSRWPAVGWAHDVDQLQAELELPPGWTLFYAGGVDQAQTTWIGRWTLLDLFVVLVAALAAGRLFGAPVGVLALLALLASYTEPGAPRWIWLGVLGAEALRRVVTRGALRGLVRAGHALLALGLVAIALVFVAQQVRVGLHPALEQPWRQMGAGPGEAGVADAALQEERANAPAASPVESFESAGKQAYGALASSAPSPRRERYEVDPNARIPTGPGRPEWSWRSVALAWSGPVAADETLSLWLLPPSVSGALALLRSALLALLVVAVLGRGLRALAGRGEAGGAAAGAAASAALAGIVLGSVALAPAPARAEFPAPALLDELRERLLAPPECAPHCAAIPRLQLRVGEQSLELRMRVETAAATGVPLPGPTGDHARALGALSVEVDGEPSARLRRDADGSLQVALPAGVHEVLLRAALPPLSSLELALPLRPRRVEVVGPGRERVQGVHPDGSAEPTLLVLGGAAPPEPQPGAAPAALEPAAVPPFVRVERRATLGLDWSVTTHVRREAPRGAALLVEVPLLPGESVTTPDRVVRDGRVLVSLPPGVDELAWTSLLAVQDELVWRADAERPLSESWWVDASPLWHVEASGPPWIETPDANGRRLRHWRPWPGETLTLAVSRPEPIPDPTLTLDRSALGRAPGRRATDATLSLTLRSSQGGQHALVLPEGAELSQLSIDGALVPARQEGRRVVLAIHPGVQQVELHWREPVGVGFLTATPAVDVGLPGVNATTTLVMPPSRWILATSGPRLGPAVLFWPALLVLVAVAWALGRVPLTPLRFRHWLLLGLGLTQAPLVAAACVALWLLALGARARWVERGAQRSPLLYDAMQLALVALSLAALVSLFVAIQTGLLGRPEMRIAGNGSSGGFLAWYQDRSLAELPRPGVLSASIWVYRAAMLAWALWVAQALLGWLRWGYEQLTRGGGWRRLRAREAARGGPA